MNKVLWAVLIVLLAVGGYWWYSGRDAGDDEAAELGNDAGMVDTGVIETPTVTGSAQSAVPPNVKEFSVTASNFKFSTGDIKVKKGEIVRVVLNVAEGRHNWKVDGYPNVGTQILQQGQSETIEFVADKAGTFEYYCSIGSHRQMGMKGKFIVE